MVPAVQVAQAVGTHNPNKLGIPTLGFESPQSFFGVTGVHLLFDVGHDKTRVLGNAVRISKALAVLIGDRGVFQRVLARHQPPYPIKSQCFHRIKGDGIMAAMGRIE